MYIYICIYCVYVVYIYIYVYMFYIYINVYKLDFEQTFEECNFLIWSEHNNSSRDN